MFSRAKGISVLLSLIVGTMISFSAYATDSEETTDEDAPSQILVPDGLPNWQPTGIVIYDNGPLVNGLGTGVAGADESILLTTSLGMNTLGFGHQVLNNNRVADDFTVPAPGWSIDGVVFFAYQTGSTTTSTMTSVNYRIWNGPPGAGGAVVYGDTTTNQLATTEWTGVYRVTEATTGAATDRPIMAQTVGTSLGGGPLFLPPGTYWIDWQTDGTLGSGPWAPPIQTNVCVTGNGRQALGGGAFNAANDSGSGTCQQGFPFLLLNGEPGTARFAVSKNFSDDNDAEVDVMLTCNTGLPLEQPATISEGNPVNFVVVDFEPGTMDCEVVEITPDGYTASYNDGTVSADSCTWEEVVGGQFICEITNTLDQVEVEVTKEWIDENPQFAAINLAEASWSCTNVAQGSSYGWLEFFGTTDTRSFFVYPDWEFGTDCDITEVEIADGGVETDDSDCQNIELFPGDSASCTIVNTRLYEGIPTLSQYGLAVLALMMLGMGFVAYRRLI